MKMRAVWAWKITRINLQLKVTRVHIKICIVKKECQNLEILYLTAYAPIKRSCQSSKNSKEKLLLLCIRIWSTTRIWSTIKTSSGLRLSSRRTRIMEAKYLERIISTSQNNPKLEFTAKIRALINKMAQSRSQTIFHRKFLYRLNRRGE